MSDRYGSSDLATDVLTDSASGFDSATPIEPGGARPKFPAEVPSPPATPPALTCPACGYEQAATEECMKCGVVIAKYRARPAAESAAPAEPEIRSREEIAADLAGHGYTPRERVSDTEPVADDGFFAPERAGLDKGVLGGIVMMVIAVVWFGLGWAAGYIFFYPPILFVIGLFGVLKGLFTGNLAG